MLDEIEVGFRVCNAWEAQRDLRFWLYWLAHRLNIWGY